jgi:hypothetical protein
MVVRPVRHRPGSSTPGPAPSSSWLFDTPPPPQPMSLVEQLLKGPPEPPGPLPEYCSTARHRRHRRLRAIGGASTSRAATAQARARPARFTADDAKAVGGASPIELGLTSTSLPDALGAPSRRGSGSEASTEILQQMAGLQAAAVADAGPGSSAPHPVNRSAGWGLLKGEVGAPSAAFRAMRSARAGRASTEAEEARAVLAESMRKEVAAARGRATEAACQRKWRRCEQELTAAIGMSAEDASLRTFRSLACVLLHHHIVAPACPSHLASLLASLLPRPALPSPPPP